MTKNTKKEIEIAGVKISLTQKKMRNLRLRISPPEAEVRVSAPLRYSLAQISEFVLQKIDWIQKSQAEIIKAVADGKFTLPPKFISGEEHYIFGKKFTLELLRNSSVNKVILKDDVIELHVKKLSNFAQRQKLLDDFYRARLKEVIPGMIEKYEKIMNVKVAEFGVKKMKTRWGTCNSRARRIWLGLELGKRPIKYLESIVVHEMTHLLEQKHSKRFYALMDKFMPDWKKWEGVTQVD